MVLRTSRIPERRHEVDGIIALDQSRFLDFDLAIHISNLSLKKSVAQALYRSYQVHFPG